VLYFIAPIIGTGAKTDRWRTAIEGYTGSVVNTIPQDTVTGQLLTTWALVAVPSTIAPAQLSAIQADATIDQAADHLARRDARLARRTSSSARRSRSSARSTACTAVAGLTNARTPAGRR
jgi:hypothetical protein